MYVSAKSKVFKGSTKSLSIYFYKFLKEINQFLGPIFSLQVDTEGDIITGGGKDGRIVATSPDGEILDETSLPDYVGGARCVVIGKERSKTLLLELCRVSYLAKL